MINKKTIAVLTSGGDAPAMNACLYYLTSFLEKQNFNVVAFIGGFSGLIENKTKEITSEEIKPFLSNGGSFIKAGRCTEFKTKKGIESAIKNIKKLKAEALIVIGGNGTFCGMAELSEVVNMIGIPATIDNDLYYTDSSLGFDSATNENIKLIKNIKNSCKAQSKLPIIEIMGRDCSKLALATAIGVGADICITKEIPVSESVILDKIKKLIEQKREDIVVVAVEKLIDLDNLSKKISSKFNIDSRLFVNSYAQRGGDASAMDIMLAFKLATQAVELIINKDYKKVVGIKNGESFSIGIKESLQQISNFEISTYNKIYK